MKKVKVIKRTIGTGNQNNIDNNEKVKVAPYVRVSTDDEEQLNSFESQMKYYTNSKEVYLLLNQILQLVQQHIH